MGPLLSEPTKHLWTMVHYTCRERKIEEDQEKEKESRNFFISLSLSRFLLLLHEKNRRMKESFRPTIPHGGDPWWQRWLLIATAMMALSSLIAAISSDNGQSSKRKERKKMRGRPCILKSNGQGLKSDHQWWSWGQQKGWEKTLEVLTSSLVRNWWWFV